MCYCGLASREQAEELNGRLERSELRPLVIVQRHQWIAAVTAFANPVLALGPMAIGAVQLRMLSEMAAAYNVTLSAEYIEIVGRQMAQTLFKLGIAEAAASLLAGILKFNPLGFAAGGAVQAITMAYLTRLTGNAFFEYLEGGQTWGEGGMQGARLASSKPCVCLGLVLALRAGGRDPAFQARMLEHGLSSWLITGLALPSEV